MNSTTVDATATIGSTDDTAAAATTAATSNTASYIDATTAARTTAATPTTATSPDATTAETSILSQLLNGSHIHQPCAGYYHCHLFSYPPSRALLRKNG